MLEFILDNLIPFLLIVFFVVVFIILTSFLLYKIGLKSSKKLAIFLAIIPVALPSIILIFCIYNFFHTSETDYKGSFESVIGFKLPESGKFVSGDSFSNYKKYHSISTTFEFSGEDYQFLLQKIKDDKIFIEKESPNNEIKYIFTTKKNRQDDDEEIRFYNDLKTVQYYLFDYVGN